LTACFAQGNVSGQLPALAEVEVTAPRDREWDAFAPLAASRVGGSTVVRIAPDAALSQKLDAILVNEGAVYWSAANSLGISDGLGQRGFVSNNQGNSQLQASRNYLNGHADLAWRFSRHPATLERVTLAPGHDAVLLGAGTPGGALLQDSKTSTGTEHTRVALGAQSLGGRSAMVDLDREWGALGLRSVVAADDGARSAEGVTTQRNAALVSGTLALPVGKLRLDVEFHGNATPYPFGTVYAGNQFWWDAPLVDTRSSASRHYRRQALYYEHHWSPQLALRAYTQAGNSQRDEVLLGFWEPTSANTVSGYYRVMNERNTQNDAGIELRGQHAWQQALHRWTVALQSHGQDRVFYGPHNIAGFSLDLNAPVFPADLGALALIKRYTTEAYQERGLAAVSAWEWGDWQWRLGARRAAYALDSATSAVGWLPRQRVGEAGVTTASGAVGWNVTPTQHLWLSQAQSFLPNRGTFSGGEYLPPSSGQQWEMGWRWTDGGEGARHDTVALQAFWLRQTNVPAKDPNDPTAYVLQGSTASRGVVASATAHWGALSVRGTLTVQTARIETPTSQSAGRYLLDTPDRWGTLTLAHPVAAGRMAWQMQATDRRPMDSLGKDWTASYVVHNLEYRQKMPTTKAEWVLRLHNVADLRYARAATGVDNVWQGEPRRLEVVWTGEW
jgi:hypothetical protein